MSKKERGTVKKSTSAAVSDLEVSPFAGLEMNGLEDFPLIQNEQKKQLNLTKEVKIGRGERLEIRREKSGRGGKTVTTVKGLPSHIGQTQRDRMLKILKSSIGTGGTWNNSVMELQGDRRENVYDWLSAAGFKPVFAGG